jgi:hypothetical protein
MDEAASYLEATRREFDRLRRLAEKAVGQVGDGDLHAQIDGESNSLAVLLRHVGGNLASRFSEFLTTDGEKPDRDRDGEFEDPALTRAEVLAAWEKGWGRLLSTLDSLGPGDLERTVTIRGEPHSVLLALQRSLSHTAQHVGQIVFLAKHLAGGRWKTLSIPRGESRGWKPLPPPVGP